MQVSWGMFLNLVLFLWQHAPRRQKYLLIVLALLAGFSRDLVMIVINKAASSGIQSAIQTWLPVFLVLLVTFIGSSFSYQVLTTSVTTDVINNVRIRLLSKLLQMQPAFIERYEHGSLYHILTTDVGVVAGFTSTLLGLAPLVVFLVLAVPQLFIYSVVAGLFSVLVMAGGVLAYYVQQRSMADLGVDARKWDVAYFESVSEMLGGQRELKLHAGRRADFLDLVRTVLGNLRRALVAVSKVYETGEAIVNALKFALVGGIVFLVPFIYTTESHVVFSLLTLVLFCMAPFEQLVSSYPAVVGTLVSHVRISALERDMEPHRHERPEVSPVPVFSSLSLREVTASHRRSVGEGFTLGPVSLDIKAGEIIFLVGENGSGKTTLLNVLAGLHNIDSGTVLINNTATARTTLEGHRSNISAVFANFHIFRQLLGLQQTSDETANAMIGKVGLQGVTSVQSGTLTRTALSAGQRRRLALAIALLENRDILILDEFIADQDPGQRRFFFNELLPVLKASGKTIILSLHDMSWASAGDRVITLRNGQIESDLAAAVTA